MRKMLKRCSEKDGDFDADAEVLGKAATIVRK